MMSKASVDLPEPDTPVTHRHARARNRDVDVAQVVLAGAVHDDRVACARRRSRTAAAPPAPASRGPAARTRRRSALELARARARCASPRRAAISSGVPAATSVPPPLAAFRPEVDDPVGRADHVEVVLDDDQRMPGVEQPAERAQQLRDVVEVQAGRRLVEQEQLAARRGHSPFSAALRSAASVGTGMSPFPPRWPASFRRCASPPDSVGTGWPSRR